MKYFNRHPDSELEDRLRASRPEPDSTLVRSIASRTGRATEAARPKSLRVAFAVATVGVVAALAAFGGVSYAASGVSHAASAVKHVFVAPKGESKADSVFTKASVPNGAIPSKTSAGDEYGAGTGPFLPPGVTPAQAFANFDRYVIGANDDLRTALNCNRFSGRAKVACLARLKVLLALRARQNQQLDAALAKLNGLSPDKQNIVATLLAIHIQQQQALAAAQAARRANCAKAAYRAAHPLICAKANPATEAAERLRLGTLQLNELNALLAAL